MTQEIDLISEQQRADLAHLINVHTNDTTEWLVTGSPLDRYNGTFKYLLHNLTGNRTIENALLSLGVDHQSIIALNLMGDTLPIAQLGVRGIGVELIDNKRSPELVQKDIEEGRTVVEGDLDEESTWDKIKSELQGGKVHLGLWRSVGGVTTLPVTPDSIFRQIQNTDTLLVPDSSLYLADLSAAATVYDTHSTPLLVHFISHLTDALNKIEGMEAAFDYKAIPLHKEEYPHHTLNFGYRRSKNAPVRLPIEEIKSSNPLLAKWIELSGKYVPRSQRGNI